MGEKWKLIVLFGWNGEVSFSFWRVWDVVQCSWKPNFAYSSKIAPFAFFLQSKCIGFALIVPLNIEHKQKIIHPRKLASGTPPKKIGGCLGRCVSPALEPRSCIFGRCSLSPQPIRIRSLRQPLRVLLPNHQIFLRKRRPYTIIEGIYKVLCKVYKWGWLWRSPPYFLGIQSPNVKSWLGCEKSPPETKGI